MNTYKCQMTGQPTHRILAKSAVSASVEYRKRLQLDKLRRFIISKV